jgi:hypothetical protein
MHKLRRANVQATDPFNRNVKLTVSQRLRARHLAMHLVGSAEQDKKVNQWRTTPCITYNITASGWYSERPSGKKTMLYIPPGISKDIWGSNPHWLALKVDDSTWALATDA